LTSISGNNAPASTHNNHRPATAVDAHCVYNRLISNPYTTQPPARCPLYPGIFAPHFFHNNDILAHAYKNIHTNTNYITIQTQERNVSMANTDFSAKARKTVAAQLHILLANEYVLYTKTQKFHWNVTGKWFGPLHLLFEKHYQELAAIVDGVAERSLMLGIKTIGTLQEFLKYTTLTENPGNNPSDTKMIEILLLDHETIIETLREDITTTTEVNDMGTNNFLCDLLEKHEKMAWMLRAHLEK